MRYLSLFSGIEAASVAWSSLGWECAAVAEIEPFPSAVLKHRFPDVPNLGDITKITQAQIEQLGHIDVAVWGFPCQDLSLAGNRKGLNHADGSLTRSGLFFTALQITEWAKARWLVGENVPGLFSSNEGRDFAAVVGELAGIKLGVPPDGWANAGVALGSKGLVEWATVDAQYCRVDTHPRAVPQRRRRVFLVRDSGTDWERRPPVFLIPQSLRGNPAPSRRSGQRPPTAAAACAGDGGPCAGTQGSRGTRSHTELDGHGAHVIEPKVPDVCPTISESGGHARPDDNMQSVLTLIPTVMAHGQAGAEVVRDGSPSLSCNHEAPILFEAVAFKPSHFTRDKDGAPSATAPPLSADADKGDQDTLVLQPQEIWDSTCVCGHNYKGPLSMPCPKCGAFCGETHGNPTFAQEVADPLIAGEQKTYTHEGENNFRTRNVMAFDTTQITSPSNISNPKPGDPCHPLAATAHPPAIAAYFSPRVIRDSKSSNAVGITDGEVHDALQSDGPGAIAFQSRIARNGRGQPEEVCPALNGTDAGETSDMRPLVAVLQDARGLDKKQNGAGFSEEDVAYTADAAATQGVALGFQPRHYTRDNKPGGKADTTVGSLTSNTKEGDTSPHVQHGTAVRRLTPTECERLQGFPDGWTKIPSKALLLLAPSDFEGDPNNPKHWAADGPRYKALGNSMATNCMRWIGKRLMQLEALTSKSSTPS